MNLLEMVLNSQNGALVRQLARNFGVGEDDARNAVSQMVPPLARGVRNNVADEGGLNALLKALSTGNHQRFLDDPEELGKAQTVEEGNGILGHILGSKDVSRRVAGAASTRTGIDAGILKQMLPLVASMVMGAVSKQVGGGGGLGALTGSGQSSGALGMLSSFLDADRDGSVLDDLLGIAKRLF